MLAAHNDLFTDLTAPGRGHRDTTMLAFFREAGTGISVGTDTGSGNVWDSLYIVQDFGTQTGSLPFVTGVVYHDLNRDGFYNPAKALAE